MFKAIFEVRNETPKLKDSSGCFMSLKTLIPIDTGIVDGFNMFLEAPNSGDFTYNGIHGYHVFRQNSTIELRLLFLYVSQAPHKSRDVFLASNQPIAISGCLVLKIWMGPWYYDSWDARVEHFHSFSTKFYHQTAKMGHGM